ncbi:putative membrane protein Bcell_0381 [Dendrobates tinctorius]|uniref:putative membrane protein Bcell_0381 n=1 Tax=Dendrobates tinctorius TaxID=92724 RepID=UPI003CC95B71
MNNCDLEKLSVSGVKLEPPFTPDITRYQAVVPSQVARISVDAWTSDSGATWTLLGGSGSRLVTLKDGLNPVVVDVTAEDGTTKKYVLEITKLSASHVSLEGISLSEGLDLAPSFAPDVFEYSCTYAYYLRPVAVNYHCLMH